jgi:hypothetical protein
MTRRGEGEASFDYDGKSWKLRLDFNAMADFEEKTGKDCLATLEEMASGRVPATEVRVLVWAMLQDHHPGVTIREAGRMAKLALAALNATVASAMPDAAPVPEGEASPAGKLTAVPAATA